MLVQEMDLQEVIYSEFLILDSITELGHSLNSYLCHILFIIAALEMDESASVTSQSSKIKALCY